MSAEPAPRTVFCVSDHTGLTAEAIAHSLISQFEGVTAQYQTRPFVDTIEKLEAVVAEIDEVAASGPRPIVFSTLSDPALSRALKRSAGLMLGLFHQFVQTLTEEFGVMASSTIGTYHGIHNTAAYQVRLDAVDFALTTDDGLGIEHYADADVILVGVSRVGKTPTCLYLAMQYGIRAANFPLTPETLDGIGLPEVLEGHAANLHGLTIDPVRLYQIRQKRRPGSKYAELERCADEVAQVERLFKTLRLPVVDSTARSIEEITATVIEGAGLERRLG